jgi:hypothetical protein
MMDTDQTAPWFNFLSYIRCCESLGVIPSITKYLRYEAYYKSHGIK